MVPIGRVQNMRHQSKRGVRTLSVLLLAFAGATGGVQAKDIGVEEGQLYPDFRLPSVDGEIHQLSDYRGKKILLFHFASW